MRLRNETGISTDTTIVDKLGNRIGGVCAIRLDPIQAEAKIITADLEFEFIDGLDVEIEPHVSLPTASDLAAQHGMLLVKACERCTIKPAQEGGDNCFYCDDRLDNGPAQRALDSKGDKNG